MGLLPPVLLGAFLIVAFALSAQQRLAIASHNGPMPARQIAYQMRVHHWAAVRLMLDKLKLDPNAYQQTDIVDALNDGDYIFLSCMKDKTVQTVMMTITGVAVEPRLLIGDAEAHMVLAELVRQSAAPNLAQAGPAALSITSGLPVAQITDIPEVGLTDGLSIQTASGSIPMPVACMTPFGAPVMATQVAP